MVQVLTGGIGSMLTAVIATHESERSLVPTLAALVPGATAGLLTEVIVTDGGSDDATAEVADYAGCRFMRSAEPLGARLRAAAASTRTSWLLFLRAGTVPESGWIAAAERFMQAADLMDGMARAAVFRPPAIADLLRPGMGEILALLRVVLGGPPRPEQGLLIARRFYDALGGHEGDAAAEASLLRKVGRGRIAVLACAAAPPR